MRAALRQERERPLGDVALALPAGTAALEQGLDAAATNLLTKAGVRLERGNRRLRSRRRGHRTNTAVVANCSRGGEPTAVRPRHRCRRGSGWEDERSMRPGLEVPSIRTARPWPRPGDLAQRLRAVQELRSDAGMALEGIAVAEVVDEGPRPASYDGAGWRCSTVNVLLRRYRPRTWSRPIRAVWLTPPRLPAAAGQRSTPGMRSRSSSRSWYHAVAAPRERVVAEQRYPLLTSP